MLVDSLEEIRLCIMAILLLPQDLRVKNAVTLLSKRTTLFFNFIGRIETIYLSQVRRRRPSYIRLL
jgi:hypothetical protein